MPCFRACPECEKNGVVPSQDKKHLIPCPICRKDSQLIGQAGWAFKETINSYYQKQAQTKAKQRTSVEIEIFKKANPDISNSKIKKQSKILLQMFMQEELAKYSTKIIPDN